MSDSFVGACIERVALTRQLVLRDPALLGDYARWFLAEHGPRAAAPPSFASSSHTLSLAEVSQHIGTWQSGPALELVRDYWRRPAPATASLADAQAASMAADPSLGELVYGLVRALQPEVVVETGVATGVTSAFLLAALADNGRGHLHSVDLPPTRMVAARLVGVAVPGELRKRWSYHWGSSRRLLPGVLRSLDSGLQLFVHDSDHGYDAMRWEMEMAWVRLAPGGWLVVDDATLHSAVDDFAALLGVEPMYVHQTDKPAQAALLRKPAPLEVEDGGYAVAGGASRKLQPR